MNLTLRVISEQPHGLARNASKTFLGETGTIGRRSDNDWVLPDPELLVSGQHAVVEFSSGCYYLRDRSTNGTYVNGLENAVGRGNRTALRDGDRVYIGDYVIEASLVTQDACRDGDPALDFDWPDDDRPTQPEERGAGNAEAQGDDGLATPYDHIPGPLEQLTPPGAHGDRIPSDWDQDIMLAGLDFELPEAAGEPPLIGRQEQQVREGTWPDQTSSAPPISLEQQAAPVGSTKQQPALAEGQAAPGRFDAVAAFMEGAGLSETELSEEAARDLMPVVGGVFREMVKGLRDALMARAEFKRGFRAQQTVITPSGNNPLKFTAGDVEETMRTLLFRQGTGYMPAPEAVREGLQDLADHQLAMMVGMKAGLQLLLNRFDPDRVKRQVEAKAGRQPMLPVAKKARLWDQYLGEYHLLAQDTEDDFQAVFGDEFVSAYENQAQALDRERKAQAG